MNPFKKNSFLKISALLVTSVPEVRENVTRVRYGDKMVKTFQRNSQSQSGLSEAAGATCFHVTSVIMTRPPDLSGASHEFMRSFCKE